MKNAFIFLMALLTSILSALCVGELTFSIFWLLVSIGYLPEAISDLWNLLMEVTRWE